MTTELGTTGLEITRVGPRFNEPQLPQHLP
jgi:hypothetical protein